MILDVARSVILEQGFAELSLRNVAELAGVRLATLQYYFRTREDLFQSAFRYAADAAWNRITGDFPDRAGDDHGKILQRFLKGLDATAQDPEIAGFFTELWAQSRLNDFAAGLMQEYYAEAIEHLAGLLRNNEPAIRGPEARHRAMLIMATVEGLTVFSVIKKGAPSRMSLPQARAVRTLIALAHGQRAR